MIFIKINSIVNKTIANYSKIQILKIEINKNEFNPSVKQLNHLNHIIYASESGLNIKNVNSIM